MRKFNRIVWCVFIQRAITMLVNNLCINNTVACYKSNVFLLCMFKTESLSIYSYRNNCSTCRWKPRELTPKKKNLNWGKQQSLLPVLYPVLYKEIFGYPFKLLDCVVIAILLHINKKKSSNTMKCLFFMGHQFLNVLKWLVLTKKNNKNDRNNYMHVIEMTEKKLKQQI